MSKIVASRLTRFRPTTDTKFQIDYNWWEKSGKNFRLYLRDQLCDECRERFDILNRKVSNVFVDSFSVQIPYSEYVSRRMTIF